MSHFHTFHTPWKVSPETQLLTWNTPQKCWSRTHSTECIHREWVVFFLFYYRDYRLAASGSLISISLHKSASVSIVVKCCHLLVTSENCRTPGTWAVFFHSDCLTSRPKPVRIFVQILWPHWRGQRCDSDWIISLQFNCLENVEAGDERNV